MRTEKTCTAENADTISPRESSDIPRESFDDGLPGPKNVVNVIRNICLSEDNVSIVTATLQ
jgi:hypothetical protein